MWIQRQINLTARPRGFHLITDEILENLPELSQLTVGVCHLFIKLSSVSLIINENAAPQCPH